MRTHLDRACPLYIQEKAATRRIAVKSVSASLRERDFRLNVILTLCAALLVAVGCSSGSSGNSTSVTYPAKSSMSAYYVSYDNPVQPNAPGYKLPLDLDTVGNYYRMNVLFELGTVVPLLEQNGFAIKEYDFDFGQPEEDPNADIVAPYTLLKNGFQVPIFITADTLLHLYHIQFDETLKDVEEREFFDDIKELTAVLLDQALVQYETYDGDLEEAARRNVAYLAVANKLIDPDAEIPALVSDLV